MTRRERLERKLEKRQEWAESRQADATRRFETARQATEHIPLGQPILAGHHSEKRHRAALARSDRNMAAGCESLDMAKHHESKAAGLERQLETAVFSDDADAIEQLEARIAEREAERDRWKAYNASCRKGPGDMMLLDESQRKDLQTVANVCPYQIGKNGKAPGYILTNLNSRIRSDRERIEAIKQRTARVQEAEASGGTSVHVSGDWCRVTFAEKPARAVLDALKAAGFRWGAGSWSGRADKLPDCVTATEKAPSSGLANCAPSFQADLAAIAQANNMTAEDVYALWRKYASDCQNYDQSAILSEFLSWYSQQLPNLPEGYHRLG